MSYRRYVDRLTKKDEGSHVVAPGGKEWRIRSVVKTREGGRRRWEVYLQDPDRRGRYEKKTLSSITNGRWRWAEGHRPHGDTLAAARSTSSAEYDEDGRRLCDACGEPIFFIRTQGKGKAMPVEADGIAAADVVDRAEDLSSVSMVTRAGHVLTGEELKAAARENLTVFRSHFASCSNPNRFRS